MAGQKSGLKRRQPDSVERLLHAALDAGLNVIDTAECYGGTDGHPSSEELIGSAISGRRKDFFLFTKCGHASAFPGEKDWDAALLEKSIDRSLKRLQTETIDLIQLHSCDEATLRQGDVIAILQKARDAGKTRFIGYSGDNDAAYYAVTCGAFDTLQTSINIADQSVLERNLPEARARQMGVIAKRPVANVAWRSGAAEPSNGYYKSYWERLHTLAYPFLTDDTADPVSVALRFTLGQPGVTTAIVGTKNPERWGQNAALLNAGPLSPQEVEAIRSHWRDVSGPDWNGQQ